MNKAIYTKIGKAWTPIPARLMQGVVIALYSILVLSLLYTLTWFLVMLGHRTGLL